MLLASCTTPDEVHVGTGYRDEQLGVTPYTGPTIWMEGVWKLKPTEIALDLDTKLFLSNQGAHDAGESTVNVNLPEEPKSDIEVLLDQGKDSQGNWTPWGALVVVAVLVFWLEKRRRKAVREKSA